ncbi:IS1182 family transposase [Ornithinimicrobium sp. LYQ103]|uniref:IS1182 family transposase n=1 Tax=Ornithinimicrobium sp. LYQ103 TaxID=3378796 RepID=UPI00385212B3
MQGEADRQRELLDVEALAGHLLPAGSVFAFLAAHRLELFPASMFADLFPSGLGRPSIPPEVIASVLVLQALHGYSDREAAEALTFDLRWKAACGYAVDAAGFHPSTLTYWRKRLASSKRPQRIFEAVREVITATGSLAGKQRRALDSTVLDDAVARQDTITQLIASIRRVARDVGGAAEVVTTHCTRLAQVTGQDYTVTGKPRIAWDDEAAREELVTALVNDALALLTALDAAHQDEAGAPDGLAVIEAAGGNAAQAVTLLALVAGQDVEPAEGSDGTDGRWRIARKTAPDRMISTVDPDARHAHKTRERRQDGFKAHVVIEPDTGLMTKVALTRTTGTDNSDASVGAALVTTDPTLTDTTDVQVLGDSAYASGSMFATLDAQKWAPVLKPWPLRPAVPDGFTLDDFTHDPTARTLTCPAGTTRTVSPKGNATFGAACTGCPLRARCTTAKDGRTITLGEHHHLQREHRRRAQDPDFQAVYRQHRPMVERSIAWLTRGARRVPYRGVTKNDAWLHHRAAGLNLRRLLRLGLTLQDGTWAIA